VTLLITQVSSSHQLVTLDQLISCDNPNRLRHDAVPRNSVRCKSVLNFRHTFRAGRTSNLELKDRSHGDSAVPCPYDRLTLTKPVLQPGPSARKEEKEGSSSFASSSSSLSLIPPPLTLSLSFSFCVLSACVHARARVRARMRVCDVIIEVNVIRSIGCENSHCERPRAR